GECLGEARVARDSTERALLEPRRGEAQVLGAQLGDELESGVALAGARVESGGALPQEGRQLGIVLRLRGPGEDAGGVARSSGAQVQLDQLGRRGGVARAPGERRLELADRLVRLAELDEEAGGAAAGEIGGVGIARGVGARRLDQALTVAAGAAHPLD